jgi:hypothetical protein
LQQELELLKQQGGKKSRIINQIVRDDGAEWALDLEQHSWKVRPETHIHSHWIDVTGGKPLLNAWVNFQLECSQQL